MASFIKTVSAPPTPRSISGNGLAFAVGANHHPAKALTHIVKAGSERENRHDFAGHRDIKAGEAFHAFLLPDLARW